MYREALGSPTWEAAVLNCDRVGDLRDTCLLESMKRLQRRETADCELVSHTVADECRFLYAERQAIAGNAAEAMAACQTTRYGRECGYHLLREAVRPVASESPAQAAPALAPWRDMPGTPDASRQFWKAYYRQRIVMGLTSDPADCLDKTCVMACREVLFSTLGARAGGSRDTLCTAPPEVPSRWLATEQVTKWVVDWTAQECRKQGIAPPVRAIPAGP